MISLIKEKVINYDRPDALKLLLKRVEALKNNYRQNIAIVGPQSIGKTTLIFNLLHNCSDNKIIPLYIKLKQRSLEVFCNNFIGILLYEYIKSIDEDIQDNIDYLINKSKNSIPKTVNAITKINKLFKNPCTRDKIFSDLLDLPQTLFEETGKPILLIFDEFQNLENLGLGKPYQQLSNKIMVQKNTMYIMVSSSISQAHNILNNKLSLLFGNFEVIDLKPFNSKTAEQVIESQLSNYKIGKNLLRFIIYITGGYPLYINVITDQIKCLCNSINTDLVTDGIVIDALSNTLYESHGVLNQYFINKYHGILNTNHNNLFPSILLCLANGRKKPSQISKYLHCKTKDINRYLTRLVQLDIITKKGVFNCINDPLLSTWMNLVFSPKQNSFNTNLENATLTFKENTEKILLNFTIENKKDLYQRLKELFEFFENDKVEIDNKRFMLTHFDEIVINSKNGLKTLNAKRAKKIWFCAIEDKFADENTINNFIKEAKRNSCLRKIFIAMNGIDPNAKLRALDEKIWVWDLDKINDLFTLFKKPIIIK